VRCAMSKGGSQVSAESARELLVTAQFCGNNLLLVQAAGGNNSVKCADSDVMWVKASGVRMASMSREQGFVGVRLSEARRLIQDRGLRALGRRDAQDAFVQFLQGALCNGSVLRPSLEAGFHVCLAQRVILHTHSVYLNAFTCMRGGYAVAKEALPPHTWIAYASPGFELAVAVADSGRAQEAAPEKVLLLENHGLVCAAGGAERVMKSTVDLVSGAQRYFGTISRDWLEDEAPSAALVKLQEQIADLLDKRFSAGSYISRPSLCAAFRKAGGDFASLKCEPLVPDDVVYASSVWADNSWPSSASLGRDLPELVPETFAISVPKVGLLLAGRSEVRLRAMEEMLLAQLLVRTLISRRGEAQPLPRHEIEYLAGMESEKYRLSMTGARAGVGR
jgi:ribulose-5-phosphate 4-epimerase/fuculose-1-phosphate aldolase